MIDLPDGALDLPRPELAERLLTGQMGPVPSEYALEEPVALCAYLAWLAYRRAQATSWLGKLDKRRTTFGERVSRSLHACDSPDEWGAVLYQDLDIELSDIRTEDSLWWLKARRRVEPKWSAMRRPEAAQDVLIGVDLLNDLLPAIAAAKETS